MTWNCRCCEVNPGGVLPVGVDIGDMLFWNGTEWVANAEGPPDVGAALFWDGASWVPTVSEVVPTPTEDGQVLISLGGNWLPGSVNSLIGEIASLPAEIAPFLRFKQFRYIVPENDATPTLIGITANQLSGAAFVTPTNADVRTSMPRINTTSNVANTLVGNNFTDPPCCRGNAAGVGGFFISHKFAVNALLADAVVSIGLNNAVIGGGANPSATANRIVLGADTADADLSWISVDNAGAFTKSAAVVSKANLLIGDPVTNGPCVYEVQMWAEPNDNQVTCRLINWSTGAIVNTSVITLTLPLATTNLRPTMVLSSKSAGAPATSCDFYGFRAYY